MSENLPQHIAFIMDGNGRWATAKGLPRLKGHAAGAEAVRKTIEAASKLNIPYLTFYAFSSENWKRPAEEVTGLFSLMRLYFKKEMKALMEQGVRVRFIGDRSVDGGLDQDILELMQNVELQTANNTKITATFAINYGGHNEITRAVKHIAQAVAEGNIKVGVINEEYIATHLDNSDIPYPDLMVRTSGEQRLSNYLPWQLAYAELYFTNTHWPDFDKVALEQAIEFYSSRERRFGAIKEDK